MRQFLFKRLGLVISLFLFSVVVTGCFQAAGTPIQPTDPANAPPVQPPTETPNFELTQTAIAAAFIPTETPTTDPFFITPTIDPFLVSPTTDPFIIPTETPTDITGAVFAETPTETPTDLFGVIPTETLIVLETATATEITGGIFPPTLDVTMTETPTSTWTSTPTETPLPGGIIIEGPTFTPIIPTITPIPSSVFVQPSPFVLPTFTPFIPTLIPTETFAIAQAGTDTGAPGTPTSSDPVVQTQAAIFAEATFIIGGVTQDAANRQTLQATLLGTFPPPATLDPALGITATPSATTTTTLAPTPSGPQFVTGTPQGTPGVAGSGAAGPITGDCRYTVVSGDRLYRIALRFNTTPDAITKANGITNANAIVPGQVLRIPNCTTTEVAVPATPTPTGTATVTETATTFTDIGTPPPNVTIIIVTATPGKSPNSGQVYIVKEGDTLFEIAMRFRVTVTALAQRNNISNIHLIYMGQTLIIP